MRPGIVQKEQQELQRRQQQQEQEQQESSAAWPHCCSARSVAGGGRSAVRCGAPRGIALLHRSPANSLSLSRSFSRAKGDLLDFPTRCISIIIHIK